MKNIAQPLAQEPDTTAIRFLLNGREIAINNIAPTTTILNWLRSQGYTGSKEGCAEGDCGACTVILGELSADGVLSFKSTNACIQFMPTLHGKALFTVEALRQANGALHPVQQAMVDYHGSQCGFCTPGFVMSLWGVYLDEEKSCDKHSKTACVSTCDEKKIAHALSGNLCRCTGYKPILEAGQRMFSYPLIHFDRDTLTANLQKIAHTDHFTYQFVQDKISHRFDAPQTLTKFAQLRAEFPQATILAGCTDIGLWVTKQMRSLLHLIYIGEIAELKVIEQRENKLSIGAGASLNEAYSALCEIYPQMQEMWERFASTPIRNAGTLGGNVANGSPIGDSMPALIALASDVVLQRYHSGKLQTRTLPLQDFYVAYQKKAWQPDEVLTHILVPLPQANVKFRTYKVAKRYDSDISAVCGAYALTLAAGKVEECRIAYGGMAAISQRAHKTEAALQGKTWEESTVRAAMQTLAEDFQPLSDMRASAHYRLRVAQNLLYRFYLETRSKEALSATEVSVFTSAKEHTEATA